MLYRERVSAAQPLAETGKGNVGGKRKRNAHAKTKSGGVKPPVGNAPIPSASPVTTGQ